MNLTRFPRRSGRSGALVAIIGVTSLAMAACGFPSGDAAIVGGTAITQLQLHDRVPVLKMLAGTRCGQSPQGQPPAPGDEEAACTRQALTLMIQGQILRDTAAELHVTITDNDVKALRDQIIQSGGGEEAFQAALKRASVSNDQVNSLLDDIVVSGALSKAYGDKIPEATLQRLYDENKNESATIDTAHILVPTEQEAKDILAKVTPQNFAEIAKQRSTDTGSGAKGGELGPTSASTFVPEFSDAVLAAKPGQIIGPIKSQFGYHVIWVHSIKVPALDDIRDQLVTLAVQDIVNKAFKDADVQVNPAYGRWDTSGDFPEVVPITSTDPAATPTLVPPSIAPPSLPAGGALPDMPSISTSPAPVTPAP